eukprot:gnl/TRDRNA2_/TRDRNA2_175359_c0_seq1.p2 gnl/TRDRNA2_/TRDRNA2_175359_c0~~gnl/TRDRNA2_/TRDRNA2_175359_c0_seq1.p2  ORF type:complete len:184 (-),score=43.69 gnl/TRDRNA2_/TRDRNA2_175359_c0_seq1:4-555(-)
MDLGRAVAQVEYELLNVDTKVGEIEKLDDTRLDRTLQRLEAHRVRAQTGSDVVPPPGAEVYEPAGPPWKKKAGAKKAQPELKAYDSNSFWQLAPSERGADASPCVMPPSVTVASVSTGDDAPVVPARPLPVVASRPSSAGLRADDAAARIGGMGDCGVACCGNATVTHSEVLVNTPKPTVAMC